MTKRGRRGLGKCLYFLPNSCSIQGLRSAKAKVPESIETFPQALDSELVMSWLRPEGSKMKVPRETSGPKSFRLSEQDG